MHPLVALVSLLALFLYMVMSIRVAAGRSKFGVTAPATTGHPEFERLFRVHANTLENLAVFLPSLWLFALFTGSDAIAAALGSVWLIGRVVYMVGYGQAAERRGVGFGIQALAQLALLLGAIGFVVYRLATGGMT